MGQPLDRAFGQMSYPLGQFVKGDLYLFGVRFDGLLVAQGERPSFIGSYVLDYKDQKGVQFNKLIIDKLKENPKGGVWVEYMSKNALKRTYAEKITDKKGNNYFIACGYYPEADRQRVVDLVRKGYKFMKTSGLSLAAEDFTDDRNNNFRYGDLYLVVRDIKGIVRANGKNPELVGTNEWDKKDQDGRYYVREVIKKAEEGGGWVTYKVRNSFKSTYCELVQLGIGKYVIACGLYPISKEETMILLAKSAAGFLRVNPIPNAIEQFVSQEGKFVSGDIRIFVCDTDGIFLCDGDRHDIIWRNLINAKDDNGKPYVRLFINTVKEGPAKVTYTIYGSQRVAYVQEVINGPRKFIVGSGFYL